MSTDGAVGFVQNGHTTIIFNSMDSYPSGLGNSVLDFIRRWDIDKISIMVSNFVYVNDGSEGKSFYEFDDYFEGDITNKKLLVYSDVNFIYTSLYCEWLYLIDFDEGNLEIFKGFNDKEPKGRFKNVPPSENGYYAVTLVRTIPLNHLPPTFNNKEFQ